MCGLVGIINKNNKKVDLRLLERMASKIENRGPDDEGYFIDENIGFFHKRLSIIDISQGHQPMFSSENCIVYNGEIYNYIELREELKSKGHSFNTNSDTEVILKTYEEHGLECFNKLNGMFAFLIYDKRKKRLIAARDHFGIKPLYYYWDENHLIFASEIKALLEHPSIKAEFNLSSFDEYLTFQYVLGQNTLFKNIFKIEPGHYLNLNLDSMKFQYNKYWDLDFTIDKYHTESYFIDEIKNLLHDSIKTQLRSDVPVGAHLSGGIDSSIVTLMSSKLSENRLHTFPGAFNEGIEFDETRYASEVAADSQSIMHIIRPTEKEFIDLLPKLIYSLDEPVAGPGVFPQYMVSKLAAENVKVVLGGQGGDEIYGGYARYIVAYLEQALKGAIMENNDEGEHIVSLSSIIHNLPHLKQYTPMIQKFWGNGVFEPMDKRYFRLIDRYNGNENLLSDDFRTNYNKDAVFTKFQNLFNQPNTQSYFNKMTQYDLTSNLPALLHVEDRMSMSVSLESRVPLIDHRIVELVATIPPALKFHNGEMKYLLKKAASNILPKSILERKDKIGFAVPLHVWLKNDASNFFTDILSSTKARNRGIFKTDEILKSLSTEPMFGRKLWGIINIELWFQQFIDNN